MTGRTGCVVFLPLVLALMYSAEAKFVHLDAETSNSDSGGFLLLDVNPTDIIAGVTESMTVNCSFSFHEALNMFGITSLILSKYVSKEIQQGHFVDLASLISFGPNQVNVLPELDAAFHGHLDVDGESFLSIDWSYPTRDDAGQFRCEVHGLDTMGHATEMFQTKQVTSKQASLHQLKDKVKQLHRQLDDQENLARKQSDENCKCQSQLELQNLATNQSKEITSLEKKINVLISINKALRDDAFYSSEEYNGHYYLMSKQDCTSDTVAFQTCQDIGGYLAQITDDRENQFLKDFVSQYSPYAVYVSGSDTEREGRWTFTGTDTDLVFYDWGKNEPGPSTSTNCLALWKNHQWQWADVVCTHSISNWKILCELDTV